MEHKTFEFSLPEGYREVYHIDAKDKKTGLKLTAAAAAIFVVLGILLFLFADLSEFDFDYLLLYDGVWLAAMIVYIVLHELVHGAVY